MLRIGDRIRQARVAARMSGRDLAQCVGLSHTAIAKYESEKDVPRPAVMLRLARALNVAPEFFFRTIQVELDCPRYRKKSDFTIRKQQAVEEQVREHLERYLEVEASFPPTRFTDKPFTRREVRLVESMEEVEEVAIDLRHRWDLGTDPIDNVAEALEDRGVKVLLVEADDGFDGFSCWANETIPVVVASTRKSWDRQRFDLTHETGELILSPGRDMDQEKAAHRFAGAFLVPQVAVIRELGQHRERLGLDELRILKEKWGLSMQAWVYRARDVGVISDHALREMFRLFTVAGLRKDEHPGERPAESAVRFRLLVVQAEMEKLITPVKAAELLRHERREHIRPSDDVLRSAADGARQYYASSPEVAGWIGSSTGAADE